MIKSELFDRVAKQDTQGFPKHDMLKICQTILDSMVDTLEQGKSIEIRNFGSIRVRHRKVRVVNNPKTNVLIKLNERNIPFYRASSILKKKIDATRTSIELKK